MSGTIESIPGGIRVTVQNTGPDSYRYVRIVMVSSVHHTGVSLDELGSCAAGLTSSDVICVFGPGVFEPGTTHVITIKTDGPYPANGGADLYASNTTVAALTKVGSAAGPGPCKCLSLTARILRARSSSRIPARRAACIWSSPSHGR